VENSEIPSEIERFRTAELKNPPAPNNHVPSWGPYISAKFDDNPNVVLVYAEIIVPLAGAQQFIYWSMMNPTYGKHPSYAGIQMQQPPGEHVLGNNICSIWDSDELPGDALPEVTLIGGPYGIYWDHFGGEGTGLHTSNQQVWRPGHRYAMVIRRWTRKGDDAYTYTSMFMYSFTENRWHHWMSARVPGHQLMLKGDPAGFMERYGGTASHYYAHYGSYFRMLEGGQWQRPYEYSIGAGTGPWLASLVSGPSGQDIKVQVGNTPIRDQEITLRPTQASKPTLITAPIVHSLQANYNERAQTLTCTWAVDASTPPPVKTIISISRNAVYGQDVHTVEVMGPSLRSTVITDLLLREHDNKGTYTFYLRIEYFDIFDQKSNNGYTRINFNGRRATNHRHPFKTSRDRRLK